MKKNSLNVIARIAAITICFYSHLAAHVHTHRATQNNNTYVFEHVNNVVPMNKNTYVFEHVNVIPMNKKIILSDYNVVIQNGKIKKMGAFSSIKTPKGAIVIDAKNKFMIPALSDMHVHLEGDGWNIMFPPESKFTSEEIDFNDILFTYVANGITTIQIMSAFPDHLPLREKIKNNAMLGPKMVLARMIDGAGKAWPPPLSVWINNADEAKKAVLEMHQQGYDKVKVYSFVDKGSYDAIMETAKSLKMPVDGHIPFAVSIQQALSSGQNMIAHIEEFWKADNDHSPEKRDYYASLSAKSHMWITATLVTSHGINDVLKDPAAEFSKPGMEYLSPMGLGVWTYVYQNLFKPMPEKHQHALIDMYSAYLKPFAYEFHKKGGKLLTGSDAIVIPSILPGISIHDELGELVGAGLTPYEALKVSTTNAHEFLGQLGTAGTIESGKTADLVLLDGNPLENIVNTRKIAGVMIQNRWIPKTEIDSRLKEIRDSYAKLKNKKSKQINFYQPSR